MSLLKHTELKLVKIIAYGELMRLSDQAGFYKQRTL